LKNQRFGNESFSKLTINLIDLDEKEIEGKGFEDKDALKRRHRELIRFKAKLPRECCPAQLIKFNMKMS
jgi:hypothetical protein